VKSLISLHTATIRHIWINLLLVPWLMGIVLVPNTAAQSGVGPQLTVLVEALNVRGGPGLTYPTVDLLMQGDQVTVTGQHTASGWWQVELPDGSTGWVSGGAAYVSVSGDAARVPEARAPVPSVTGSSLRLYPHHHLPATRGELSSSKQSVVVPSMLSTPIR